MNDRQILIIKHSWSHVKFNYTEAGNIFYNRLFELDPSLKKVFCNDMELQERKFIAMITFLVHKLQKIDEIITEVDKLAQRHVQYGATRAHYITIGKALIWMVEQALGPRWNEETQEAWEEMYRELSKNMLTAVQD